MRLRTLAIALLLTQATPAPQSQTATVAGTVVRQGTGELLSKATVTLYLADGRRSPLYAGTTDPNGRFAFTGVAPGQYRISAERTNYVRAEFGERGSSGCGTPVALIAGQQMSDVRIAMIPGGVIAGRLHDVDREGMPSVSAHALRYVYENGRRVLTVVQTVQTNDLGEYRLFGLTPGRYYVAAALETPTPNLVSFSRDGQTVRFAEQPIKGTRFLPTYFPGVADPVAARAVELRPGETLPGVDLTVTLSRSVRITGRIVGSASKELSVALVSRLEHPNSSTPVRTSSINPDGTFEILDVLPGAYFLAVTANDSVGRLAGLTPADVGNTDLQNVVLELSPGFELTGRVTVDEPKVMERILEVAWRSVNPALALTSSYVRARVDTKDGSFKLQGITPGDYLPFLTFQAPLDIYVKALRLGSVDVRDGIHLDSQPAQQLEIVVGSNGAVVEGTVVNDKQQPVAGVSVVLVPDVLLRKRLTLYKSGTTDAAGHFRFQTIAPGDYKVFAWEEVESGAWQDPDFLRIYETRGKAVTLREGTAEQVQISLIPSTGAIYGQCPNPFTVVR